MQAFMKPDHRDALRLALDKGIAGDPGEGLWRFYNASPIPGLDENWKQSLVCEQEFRPDYLALEKDGYPLFNEMQPEMPIAGAVFIIGRDRKWNEYQISRLWNSLDTGTRLIVTGDKNGGIASIRKWFSGHAKIADAMSKYHAVVFWADKQSDSDVPVPEIGRQIDRYHLAEGMFSADGPDLGSQILASCFDQRIKGKIADLGAGWGYLSAELVKRSPGVTDVALFEASRSALLFAEQNLEFSNCSKSFHWIDVTTEFPKKPYDWVIMNPPFHTGRAADPELGKRFIDVAASTLPSGGRLLMVANKNLPYEKTLETRFRRIEKLAEGDGFKVFEATK